MNLNWKLASAFATGALLASLIVYVAVKPDDLRKDDVRKDEVHRAAPPKPEQPQRPKRTRSLLLQPRNPHPHLHQCPMPWRTCQSRSAARPSAKSPRRCRLRCGVSRKP